MKHFFIALFCCAFLFSASPASAQKTDTQTAEEKKIVDSIPKDGSTVQLKIGETKTINSIRVASCPDSEPKSFDDLKKGLPESDIVTFSDGGILHRQSSTCGKVVPARAIKATGVKAGTQPIRFFGTSLTLVVE